MHIYLLLMEIITWLVLSNKYWWSAIGPKNGSIMRLILIWNFEGMIWLNFWTTTHSTWWCKSKKTTMELKCDKHNFHIYGTLFTPQKRLISPKCSIPLQWCILSQEGWNHNVTRWAFGDGTSWTKMLTECSDLAPWHENNLNYNKISSMWSSLGRTIGKKRGPLWERPPH